MSKYTGLTDKLSTLQHCGDTVSVSVKDWNSVHRIARRIGLRVATRKEGDSVIVTRVNETADFGYHSKVRVPPGYRLIQPAVDAPKKRGDLLHEGGRWIRPYYQDGRFYPGDTYVRRLQKTNGKAPPAHFSVVGGVSIAEEETT